MRVAAGTNRARPRQVSPAAAIFSFSRRLRQTQERRRAGGSLRSTADDAPPLVLAGEHKWDFTAVAERIGALGLGERVLCPDGIADQDLPAVYQGAMALVHPSRYEGFGLQLVEAMASGLPVLASETTSLPEVLDGCGLLFDPEDPASIARQMERISRDPDLRAAMAEKGRQRARFFSWRKAAGADPQAVLRIARPWR